MHRQNLYFMLKNILLLLTIGYFNAPYTCYEAEQGLCQTTGVFLEPTDDQTQLQSEASHQQAVQLTGKGDYVEWELTSAGKGLTVRFSLPDNAVGTGTKGRVVIYAGEERVGQLTLDSYWAWQYCSATYPTNDPKNGPVIRMRFDEVHTLLSRQLEEGETLRLMKDSDDTHVYTIDFIELEDVPAPVRWEDIESDNKVQYTGAVDIGKFINSNAGKTIYIPEGIWNAEDKIRINRDGTHLIGAGMWYTQIYFGTTSEDKRTYANRGIECNSQTTMEGIYLNTINNQRYYKGNSQYQVGKGLMGGWGKNSIVRNCWIEHFECGGWIADYNGTGSENMLIEHCRIRNNYADGINLCQGSKGHKVQYCSFRNNGDDDMASWSTGKQTEGIVFAYCTAQNNWRASSLGFFGGKNQTAHDILIEDGLECGLRVNSDFSGTGFAQDGAIELYNIDIRHCGCIGGTKGKHGDFWGKMQGAVNIGSTSNYPIYHVHLSNINVYQSRGHGLYIQSSSGKKIVDLILDQIVVDGADRGIYFSGALGDGLYCSLTFKNVNLKQNTHPGFEFVPLPDCQETALPFELIAPRGGVYKQLEDNHITIHTPNQTYVL